MRSKVIVYYGKGGWRFLMIPKKRADQIKRDFGRVARGWGSLPVAVTIGSTTWNTSIFPDSKAGTYLLPLKASVRAAERISDEATVSFEIEVRGPRF